MKVKSRMQFVETNSFLMIKAFIIVCLASRGGITNNLNLG